MRGAVFVRAGFGSGVARRDEGFSLVEVMVSLVVLAVIVALAIPTLRGLLPSVRLGNDTNILANEIALARRLAIGQSVDYSIAFDTAGDSYTLRKRESGSWKSLGSNKVNGSDIVSVSGFDSAATLIALAGGAMNVPVSVGGAANYGYVTLRTPDGRAARRIKVEPLGRIVVEKWDPIRQAWVIAVRTGVSAATPAVAVAASAGAAPRAALGAIAGAVC